jgi:hypothetical protein
MHVLGSGDVRPGPTHGPTQAGAMTEGVDSPDGADIAWTVLLAAIQAGAAMQDRWERAVTVGPAGTPAPVTCPIAQASGAAAAPDSWDWRHFIQGRCHWSPVGGLVATFLTV